MLVIFLSFAAGLRLSGAQNICVRSRNELESELQSKLEYANDQANFEQKALIVTPPGPANEATFE